MRDIYSIEQDILDCIMIDEETGEDIGTDFERLDALQMEREKKLESVAAWYKALAAEHEMVKAEKTALEKRQRSIMRRMESVKAYLFEHLQGEHITSGRVKTSYRTTRDCVDITDEKLVPIECMRVSYEPNKTAIKAMIKAGNVVPGAELNDHISLIIK